MLAHISRVFIACVFKATFAVAVPGAVLGGASSWVKYLNGSLQLMEMGKAKGLGGMGWFSTSMSPPPTSVRWLKLLSASSHLRGILIMRHCQSDAGCTLCSFAKKRHLITALKLPKCCVQYTPTFGTARMCSHAQWLCGVNVHFQCSDFFPSIYQIERDQEGKNNYSFC